MPTQGDVVLVTVLDPNGKNPKTRPAVVVTATKEITPTGKIVVAAISTKFDPARIPSHYVPIPSAPHGHAVTGLRRRCVVKCNWLKTVDCSSMTIIGRLPPPKLLHVVQQIARLESDNPLS